MCGVFGIWGHDEAANIAYLGLHSLQHRGQESAGLVAGDAGGGLRRHVAMGLVSDAFDRDVLAAVLGEVTARHEVLRTSFDLAAGAQFVHRGAAVPLTVADLSTVDAGEVADQLDRRRREERARPLPWDTPPLLRAHVDTLPGDEFAVTLTFHHAVLDGWSLASLTTELVRRYAARLAGCR